MSEARALAQTTVDFDPSSPAIEPQATPQPVTHGRYDHALVHCMVDMGRALNIRITAEGIETLEHLQVLTSIGCDFGQGYLFSGPLPASEVEDFIERWNAERASELFANIDTQRR